MNNNHNLWSGPYTHSFSDSVQQSKRDEYDPNLLKFYRWFFPDMTGQKFLHFDKYKDLQHGGIDRVIQCGVDYYSVEEKCRDRTFNDFLIEESSSIEGHKEGWIEKDGKADYLIYYIRPLKLIYVGPFQLVRNNWIENKECYKANIAKKKYTPNRDFTTLNWAVEWEYFPEMIKVDLRRI